MIPRTLGNHSPEPARHRWLIWLALIGFLGLYLLEGHARRLTIPTSRTQGDQGAYLDYAADLHRTDYAFVGGRNRMPVYPFLLTFIYEDGLSDDAFLARAQSFNVNLSAGILLVLFLILRRYFSDFWSLSLMVMTGFAVFLKRAVLVQTEVLFYLLVFVLFLLFWRLLASPKWWAAILAGLLLGIAHLTKASVLPLLVLWIAVMGAKSVWDLRRQGADSPSRWMRPACIVIVIFCFLAVTFQYLRTSRRVFGRYFYNVNSTFYIWTDSWDEAESLTKAHGDREGWPTLPPDQIPSPARYWREHSIVDIGMRIGNGIVRVLTKNAKLTDYYKYGVLLGATAIVLAIRKKKRFTDSLFRQPFVAIFITGFFGGYLLLYAWYAPISSDSRFSLSLFLPFVFVASRMILYLGSDVTLTARGRMFRLPDLCASILLAMAALDATYNAVRLFVKDADRDETARLTICSTPIPNKEFAVQLARRVSVNPNDIHFYSACEPGGMTKPAGAPIRHCLVQGSL
jgi:hypothetical protein